jgi:hypothetical protein
MAWVYNASPAVNTESNYPTILGVSITLVLLMFIVVCLRFYVRGHMLKLVGRDDWVIAAGAVSQTPPALYLQCRILTYTYSLGLQCYIQCPDHNP